MWRLVSVVMPAYRLGDGIYDNVLRVCEFLNELGYPYEVIVVDDGSDDDTYRKAMKAKLINRSVVVLRHERNLGKGKAFITGYRASKGDVVVLLDADLDIPPQQIGPLLEALHDADIAITDKWHKESRVITTRPRKAMSRGFNLAVRILTGLRLNDTQTGCKAFRRDVLEDVIPKLKISGYAFDVELLWIAVRLGYSVVSVPACYPIRLVGEFCLKNAFKMFLDLLRITFRCRFRQALG